MYIQDTLKPYSEVDYQGIQYGVCRDFGHVSRYRGLRQLVHSPYVTEDRFVALETPNPFKTNSKVTYYDVSQSEENRLDIVAYKTLGNPNYAWVIAYFNQIEDGFTISDGQRLMIPGSITDLFNKGEILASVSPNMLNLGEE